LTKTVEYLWPTGSDRKDKFEYDLKEGIWDKSEELANEMLAIINQNILSPITVPLLMRAFEVFRPKENDLIEEIEEK